MELGPAFGNLIARGVAHYLSDSVSTIGLISASGSKPPRRRGHPISGRRSRRPREANRLAALKLGFLPGETT